MPYKAPVLPAVAVLATTCSTASAVGPRTFVIQGDRSIGGIVLGRTTAPQATRGFAAEGVRRVHRRPDACIVTWPTPSNAFTVASRFAYDAASGTWRSSVKVPGPGKLNFDQRRLKPTDSATLLVRSGRVSVSGAGKVTLTLHPTTAGKAALKRSGSIRLNLSIEYSPTNGKPANKLIKATLKA